MCAALDPRTRPTGRHIGRSARGELVLRGVFPAFEGGKRAASKVVWAIAGTMSITCLNSPAVSLAATS